MADRDRYFLIQITDVDPRPRGERHLGFQPVEYETVQSASAALELFMAETPFVREGIVCSVVNKKRVTRSMEVVTSDISGSV